jgi:hypothetical protein
MKISAFHKAKGNDVDFYMPLFSKPDKIYCSKVFMFNKTNLPNEKCRIVCGGTGFRQDENKEGYYSFYNSLPDNLEHICPDYSLYKIDYSMGFITRGCIRKCSFCIVPEKEGEMRFNTHLEEFQMHKKVVLLDNNILACKEGVDELYKISKTNTKIDVNQGLDFRLVDNAIAELLAKLQWIRFIRTACDSNYDFEAMKNAVELLEIKGVKPYRIFCYCLVKSEDDIPRILEIDKLGVCVFAMGYIDFETGHKTQIVKDICHWVNRKQLFNIEKDFSKVKLRVKI